MADDDPAISFQASTLDGDLLYTCTETEVMVYSVPGFELLHYVSLPCFNDVHHVRPSPSGNIVVANAGLEMVLEITPVGEIVGSWNALGQDPWAHVDPEVDYRKISTKPHRAHPNYVFYLGTELWATRFHQGDAVSLDRPGRSVHVSDERIHDGLVHKGKIYFTTVDGKIVIVDAERLDVIETIDLATFGEDRVLLGWCRGVLVDDSRLWVGFSRIRADPVPRERGLGRSRVQAGHADASGLLRPAGGDLSHGDRSRALRLVGSLQRSARCRRTRMKHVLRLLIRSRRPPRVAICREVRSAASSRPRTPGGDVAWFGRPRTSFHAA